MIGFVYLISTSVSACFGVCWSWTKMSIISVWLCSFPGAHLDCKCNNQAFGRHVPFLQLWEETLLPLFSLTNCAIWPLRPIGSSNTKSGVYEFGAPSTPPSTDHRVKNPKLHAWWSLKHSVIEELFWLEKFTLRSLSVRSLKCNIEENAVSLLFACTHKYFILASTVPLISHWFCQIFLQSTCLYVREIEYFLPFEELWSGQAFGLPVIWLLVFFTARKFRPMAVIFTISVC